MDISVYISELLYQYDCIIIPGFGGFVCNYKSAEIHPVTNILSPPSKAITFNKSLQNNDGLLINYIAHRKYITYDLANALIAGWVSGTEALLKNGETISLPEIGELFADVEGHIQFQQNTERNYLKSSFGLKPFEATPILRSKEFALDVNEQMDEQKHLKPQKQFWRVAAIIVLLIGIAGLAQLMWAGIQIKSLNGNEAGMSSFLYSLFSLNDPVLNPLPVTVAQTEIQPTVAGVSNVPSLSAVTDTSSLHQTTPAVNTSTPPSGYYIIVGSFKDHSNVESLKSDLAQSHENVLVEPANGLTRVGYFADANLQSAQMQLNEVRSKGTSCWLLRK